MTSTNLRVSIVIPAYNEADTIEKCIMSCVDQEVAAHEIIVVNNKSTDATADIVTSLQARYPRAAIKLYHQNKAQGIIPTRDYGFAVATGDILGRIDADSTISTYWVKEAQNTFMDSEVAATTGPVVYHDMPAQKVGFLADKRIRRLLHAAARDHQFLFGSNMAVRRTAWEAIAGEVCADKEDIMHEDIDIALHLYQRNMKITYSPDMVGGMSARRLEDSPAKFYRYVMRFENTFKHHGIKSATARIPIFIYLTTYFPLKMIRSAYDTEQHKFTFSKIKAKILDRKSVV